MSFNEDACTSTSNLLAYQYESLALELSSVMLDRAESKSYQTFQANGTPATAAHAASFDFFSHITPGRRSGWECFTSKVLACLVVGVLFVVFQAVLQPGKASVAYTDGVEYDTIPHMLYAAVTDPPVPSLGLLGCLENCCNSAMAGLGMSSSNQQALALNRCLSTARTSDAGAACFEKSTPHGQGQTAHPSVGALHDCALCKGCVRGPAPELKVCDNLAQSWNELRGAPSSMGIDWHKFLPEKSLPEPAKAGTCQRTIPAAKPASATQP
eukprot:g31395.t1